jgi:hypothetical protein
VTATVHRALGSGVARRHPGRHFVERLLRDGKAPGGRRQGTRRQPQTALLHSTSTMAPTTQQPTIEEGHVHDAAVLHAASAPLTILLCLLTGLNHLLGPQLGKIFRQNFIEISGILHLLVGPKKTCRPNFISKIWPSRPGSRQTSQFLPTRA